MKKNKVSVNYFYNMIYQILTFLTPIITAPFLARTLGATNLGIYDYTYTIVNWFTIIGMFGIAIYGNKEIAKVAVKNDRKLLSQKFSQIFTLQLVNILISCAIFMGLILFTDFEYKNVFIIQGILILSSAFEISWFYSGIQDFKKISIRNIIIKALTVLGIIFLIHDANDLILYTVFLAVISVLNSLALFYKIKDYVDYKVPKLKEAYSHLKGALGLFIPQIATSIYCILGRTMIGWFYEDINEVAFYNYAYRLVTMVLLVVTAIGTVMLPRVVEIRSSGNEDEAKAITNKTLKVALLLAIPLTIGFAALAPFFIPWFLTEEFTKVGYIICILAPSIIFISMSNVFGTQYLIPFDKTKQYTMSVVAGCVVSLILNLILIKPLGAYGAAIASVFTEFIVLFVQYRYVKNDFNFQGIVPKFFKYLGTSLIMGVAVLLIGFYMGVGIVTNILQVVVAIIIYFVILKLTKDDIFEFLYGKVKELVFAKRRYK